MLSKSSLIPYNIPYLTKCTVVQIRMVVGHIWAIVYHFVISDDHKSTDIASYLLVGR